MHREILHLVGQMVDFRRTAVAQQTEVVHFVAERSVHALVLRIHRSHLRIVAGNRVEVLAELRQQVRELLLRRNRRKNRLSGLSRRVDHSIRAEGLRKLTAGELVERLERLRGIVGGLGDELKRVAIQRPVVHEFLERLLDRLPVETLRRGLGGLYKQHVQLCHQLSGSLRLLRHKFVCALRCRCTRLRPLRLRGLDAAKEVIHRNIVNVRVHI